MSDLNKANAQDLEAKGDRSSFDAGSAGGGGALIQEALDEMRKAKNTAGFNGLPKIGAESKAHGNEAIDSVNGKPGGNGGIDKGDESGHKPAESQSDNLIDAFKKQRFEFVQLPAKDGATTLATGDVIVKEGDKQTLYMPNGDKLAVNKDGSFDLKAQGPVEVRKSGDETTITYPNGDSVSFGKDGVSAVTRNRYTALITTEQPIPHVPQVGPKPVHSEGPWNGDWSAPILIPEGKPTGPKPEVIHFNGQGDGKGR